jgi:hypothetical protein
MNRYWLRIALGALGIFAVGMLFVMGVRRGKAEVSKRLGGISLAQAMIPHKLGPVTLDGAPIGSVSRLRIIRDSARAERHMDVTLVPDGPAALARIDACAALAGDLERLFEDEGEGLRCAGADTAGLARFGTLATASGELRRPLFASAEQVAKFGHEGANDEARVVDIRADSATGKAHIVVEGANGQKLVQIDADSEHGARIDIRDEHGKPVFHLQADSNGVNIDAGRHTKATGRP